MEWGLVLLNGNHPYYMPCVSSLVCFAVGLFYDTFFQLFCRESETGLINCCINGVREVLPFDTNSFELRGAAQFGDLVTN